MKVPQNESSRANLLQRAKVPRSESSREQTGHGPIGTFAPGSELARQRKGSVPLSLSFSLIQRFYCWYIMLCCDLDLWPYWPQTISATTISATCNVHMMSRQVYMTSTCTSLVYNNTSSSMSTINLCLLQLWRVGLYDDFGQKSETLLND